MASTPRPETPQPATPKDVSPTAPDPKSVGSDAGVTRNPHAKPDQPEDNAPSPDGPTEPIVPDPAKAGHSAENADEGDRRNPSDEKPGVADLVDKLRDELRDSEPERNDSSDASSNTPADAGQDDLFDALDGETRVMSRVRETFIGPYQIDVKLGDGGMGNVYKALDPKLGRNVAVKVIKDELAFNERYLERLGREARTLASLSHPALIQIYAFEDGRENPVVPPYLVMEFVDGQSLDALLRRQKKIELTMALRLAREAAEGLAAALEQGIIHRDIKPSNLLISKEGRLKIVDFGLAKEIESSVSITSDGIVLGTPEYISPEQAQGENADHRCDIYSLGCTLYHMLTGRPVFTEKSQAKILYAHIYAAPVPPHKVNPDLPEACSFVLGKMLAKDPVSRYETYEELIEDLECLEQGRAPGKHAREAAKQTYRGPGARTLRFWIGTAASVVAVFLLGISFAQLFQPDESVASARSRLAPFVQAADGYSDRVHIAFPFHRLGNSAFDPIREFFVTPPGVRTRPRIDSALQWKNYNAPLAFRFDFVNVTDIHVRGVSFPLNPREPVDFGVTIADPRNPKVRNLEFVFSSGRTKISPITARLNTDEIDFDPPVEPLPRLRGMHDLRIRIQTDDENDATLITLTVDAYEDGKTGQVYPPTDSDVPTVVLEGTFWADGLLVLTANSILSQLSLSMDALEIVAELGDNEISEIPVSESVAARIVP